MDYRITVVEDDEMPCETEWAIARTCTGVNLFIARRRSTFEQGLGDVMAAVWEASAKNGAGLPVPHLAAV